MNKSESIKELATALALFQSEVEDPTKSGDNPHFKSKFVELNGLLEAVRPVLSKHGLSIIQSPGGNGQDITITTLLMHKSGEWIEFEPFTLKAAKIDPQGAGSAVTYGRRYSLSSVLGVAWDDDDDGNKGSGKKDKKEDDKQLPPQQQSAQPPISSPDARPPSDEELANEPQRKMLYAKSKSKGLDADAMLKTIFNIDGTKYVPKSMVNKIVEYLDTVKAS
jgi:hypothetical protein